MWLKSVTVLNSWIVGWRYHQADSGREGAAVADFNFGCNTLDTNLALTF